MPFSTFGLHPDVLRGVQALGFTTPTPIQAQALPPAMLGRDVLASAKTGSGKTAAFALPILHRLAHPRRRGIRALVLTPTRELAGQIREHFGTLGRPAGLSAAAVYGGVGMGPQQRAFKQGVDVMVATPGRLLDHLRQPYASLGQVEVVVLDEADRMLDMGFLPDVRRILGHLPKQRQTLLFSATMPGPIAALAQEMLRDPATIRHESRPAAAASVTQTAYPVPADLKSALLVEMVRRGQIGSAIAFTRTKHRANRLADYLERHGVNAGRIHGNRSQSQRDQALSGFKSGRFPVLVATDVAARGIHVEALSHVVNFDVPPCAEDYVHRVGRTGRVDLRGDAFVFVSPEEENDLRGIERALGKRLERATLPDFDYSRRTAEKLEIPLGVRLAEMRSKRRAQQSGRPAAGAGRPASGRGRFAGRRG